MCLLVEALLDAGWECERVEGGLRHLDHVDAAVGAGNPELSVAEFDVGLRRLESVRRDLARLVDDLPCRMFDRDAADRERARTAGPPSEAHDVAVALMNPDLLERQAEPVGDNLGIGRLMALARGLRPDDHRRGTRGI